MLLLHGSFINKIPSQNHKTKSMKKFYLSCILGLASAFSFAESDINKTLFYADFQVASVVATQFVVYDVDELTPTKFWQTIGFAVGVPWNVARDSEDSDNYFFASCSSYDPAGQADDWLVTKKPMLIPNSHYVLKWKSQAYDPEKRDGLKVFISTIGCEYEAFDGLKPVFEVEEEEAGETMNLEGEWIEHSLSLADYVGKNINIAFVNQSYDKQIICIDDIEVVYEGSYTLTLTTESAVPEMDEIAITGLVNNVGKEVIESFDLFYAGSDNVEHKLELRNLNLAPGKSLPFEFPEKMELFHATANNYTVWGGIPGDEFERESGIVKNLAFLPLRRVVVEEGTGAWCGNCPLGIVSMEAMEEKYPDRILGVGIHNGDSYAFDAYNQYLGIVAFPSGSVNRTHSVAPAVTVNNAFSLWDAGSFGYHAEEDMKKPTVANISSIGALGKDGIVGDNTVLISTDVVFAMDEKDADYRLLFLICEDELVGNQTNYFYSNPDPALGEWGKDGKYAKSKVKIYYKDVARTIIGTDFGGIKDIFPEKIAAGETYNYMIEFDMKETNVAVAENAHVTTMLLDGKTGEVMNASRTYLVPNTGVNETLNPEQINCYRQDGYVSTHFTGISGKADLTLIASDGTLIAQKTTEVSNGQAVTLSAQGYKGLAILKISVDGKTTIKKFMF